MTFISLKSFNEFILDENLDIGFPVFRQDADVVRIVLMYYDLNYIYVNIFYDDYDRDAYWIVE